ncbi:hypothetical protein LLEC1_07349 [Akanthomyces lecanii]|uniref:Carboxypeptidase n=1 Tax=Cordyceps confragosa TaxID=2714763 RepID=A0A179IEF6_CORDF|nr:hypothetical protein LLEC1_07349 [Akanthomyces lecanii]
MFSKALLLGSITGLVAAQFPPPLTGVKTLKSKFHENVTISYKEPGLCETTPGVKSYAGHVHLPASLLRDIHGVKHEYDTNTFFWFFEARHDPENAPLAIWLNGGPGASSMAGLLQENGPCFINEDSKTVRNNPWSWNNHVNMLYIDEPNQVGFSYDTPTNFTIIVDGERETTSTVTDFSKVDIPELNSTTRVGTLSSNDKLHTVNTTAEAAHALWHFAQAFFWEFPHYKPNDDRISLWAESYGGHYGPGFARFFQQQNEKILNGTLDDKTAHYMHLDTLGIINGVIDATHREEAGIIFPFNNTYGIQAYTQEYYDELMHNFTKPGGCRDQILHCQDVLDDRDGVTIQDERDGGWKAICGIEEDCASPSEKAFRTVDHARFDITHHKQDPFPPPHALGVPVNFTASSEAVATNFGDSADHLKGGFVDAIGYLLDTGVKVHMMYGDRDFACNWIGGEMSSLAVGYQHKAAFARAGYAPLVSSDGVGGLTRQSGNFSFTRVFQAGHMIPAYQPVHAYEVFMRATFNKDIATGERDVTDELATEGPSHTWDHKTKRYPAPAPRCYVLEPGTCTEEQWAKVYAGASVKNYFLVEENEFEETEL